MDGRDVGFAEGRGRAGWAGSPEASVEWLQQIRGLQQNNMGGMGMGEQHGQNYLRIQGSEGRMPGGLGELLFATAFRAPRGGGCVLRPFSCHTRALP